MFIEGSVVSKNAKRIISILISFALVAFAIDRYIIVQINNHYHPETHNEYWILYPIVLSTLAIYFIACAFKGKFILWKNSER
jgi:hypothetical protein